jgi:hypothetical protein
MRMLADCPGTVQAAVKLLAVLASASTGTTVGWAIVAEPRIDTFLGLDAGEAVELGELLVFFSDWLASDPTGCRRRYMSSSVYRTTSARPARSTNCVLSWTASLACCGL